MENTVIERIKQFCAKEGLSVSELAKALNVAQRTTNSYINEGRTPSFSMDENNRRRYNLYTWQGVMDIL